MPTLSTTFGRLGAHKQSRELTIRLLVLLAICLFSRTAEAKYGGGTGEPNDPYLIYTAEQMNAIGADSRDWDKHFKLMADIDLSSYTGTEFNIIGNSTIEFTGVFDGNDKKISNFNYVCTDTDGIGLFGYVNDPNAQIKDLGLIDPNVDTGTGDHVGSLVGGLGEGSIVSCYAQAGSVSGDRSVGGLVGGNGGTISMCYSTSRVTGNSCLGGLVGGNGGLVLSCHSMGSVSGDYEVGGLVGDNSGIISDCYSRGSVSGDIVVGGLVAANGAGIVSNCYATGSVVGNLHVGGLVGCKACGCCDRPAGPVCNSFWDTESSGQATSDGGTGKMTTQMQDPNTFKNAGWAFVSDPNTGPNYDWAESVGGGYMILWWQLSPLLPLPTFSGGTGKPNDPYLISTAVELNSIGHHYRLVGVHFKLINDIDLTGVEFFVIGSYLSPFKGTFDGNGFEIANFTCSSTGANYTGLFEYVDGKSSMIKDLRLIDPNINAARDYYVGSLVGMLRAGTITGCSAAGGNVSGMRFVGGLVGGSDGKVVNCYSTSRVEGDTEVGGLIGYSYGTVLYCYSSGSVFAGSKVGGLVGRFGHGTMSECYSSSVVSGESEVGGLVGASNGNSKICNCYSSGEVSGNDKIGGLVGSNWGAVVSCYSSGFVSGNMAVGGLAGFKGWRGVTYISFWDTQTSGQSSSEGGTGKTTAEMQMASTFTGWGCDPVWTLDEGNDYPRLWWENMPGETITTPAFESIMGSGTENDPYLIYTAEELNMVGLFPCEWSKHFTLMADIDLSIYKGTDFNIIGEIVNCPFTGVFDGNGHRIWNFSYRSAEVHSGGLFGYVSGPGAEIKNLGIVDAVIDLKAGYSGVLAFQLVDGTITDCYVEGTGISGGDVLGGLVGINWGTICSCYTTNDVNGESDVGGLVGRHFGGDILNCYTTGNISSVAVYSQAGGLVGEHRSGTISNCYALGSVSGTGTWVGGLVGYNWATITTCYATAIVSGSRIAGGLAGGNRGDISECYATGNISGGDEVGGLVGRNSDGTVSNCYFTGGISGNDETGGLVGINLGEIMNCYSSGEVSTAGPVVGGAVGGNGSLTLHGDGMISGCFWDKQTGGLNNMCGNQTRGATGCDNTCGKTTAEMQMESTFTDAGWDFVGESENGTEDIWTICEGEDYPKLAWQFVIGDFDSDDDTDFVDFSLFCMRWLSTDSSFYCGGGGADLTNDGNVDVNDLKEFTENWLDGVSH